MGFWELAVIGLVALLVVGPQRMPGMIRTIGEWVGYAQRIARDVRRELDLEVGLTSPEPSSSKGKLTAPARSPAAAETGPQVTASVATTAPAGKPGPGE